MRRLEHRVLDLGVALDAVLIDLVEFGQGGSIRADDGIIALGERIGEPVRVVEVDGVRCVVALGRPFLRWVAGDANDGMAPGEELVHHAGAALPFWPNDSYLELLLWGRHGEGLTLCKLCGESVFLGLRLVVGVRLQQGCI